MKIKIILLSLIFALTSFLSADDHIELAAMEGLQCNFSEGKDMDDVMRVISHKLYNDSFELTITVINKIH